VNLGKFEPLMVDIIVLFVFFFCWYVFSGLLFCGIAI
jgi:hypothetical protein